MPGQAEEHRTSLPDEENSANAEDVRSRISELLDNATVAPEDDFARDLSAQNQGGLDEGALNDGAQAARSQDKVAANEVAADMAESVANGNAQDSESADRSVRGDEEEPVSDAKRTSGEPSSQDASSPSALPESDLSEREVVETEPVAPTDEVSGGAVDKEDAEIAAQGRAPEADEAGVDGDALPEGQPPSLDGDQVTPATVRIRGRPGGVLVEIEDEGEWSEILELLEQRLAAAEGFFRGGKAVVETGARDVYEDELRQARDMLARHDMTLAVVRSTSDLTLQSSLLLGLSTSSQAEAPVDADREMAPVVPITQPKSPYFVHNGTLRSGQVLRKAESIMIVGDVNPGAKVISGGDVMVWGRLRGMAYAGATGNKGARVAAIEFSPTQLRIASVTAVPPDAPKKRGLRFWKKPTTPQKRPEVAHVSNGRIVVELWDDSKPGRPSVARK